MKLRELWQQLKHPRGLRVIHVLPKGLGQDEPVSFAAARKIQRIWLRRKKIRQVKAVIAVKP